MKRIFLLLFLSVYILTINAAENEGDARKGGVKGFVFDADTKVPLEYATIAIKNKTTNKLDGTITDQTGFFRVTGLDFGKYSIEVTFIGYETKVLSEFELTDKNNFVDMGQVSLKSTSESIDEAVIVSDRPTVSYRIDKKVINVSQQHTSASGTAVELLETIPSVTVDITGNVALRGSTSFTVLIDGKPTVLEPSEALNQIPASAIQNIEIITNPSAKFDPDGSSGIINIITKKNQLQGITGVVNLNGGYFDNYGSDFLFNYRKERFNFYLGADISNRMMFGLTENENRTTKHDPLDLNNDTTTTVISNGRFNRGGLTYGIRGGFDVSINAQNTLSIGGRYGYRSMDNSSLTDFNVSTNPISISNNYKNVNIGNRGGDFYSINLDFTHKFAKKGHELVMQFITDYRNFDENSENQLVDINNIISFGQKNIEEGPERGYRGKLDYVLPIGEKDKFEAGYQLRISNGDEFRKVYNYQLGDYVLIDTLTHKVNEVDDIHSLYSTYSGNLKNFGYQVGLRGEYTYRVIDLLGENQTFTLDQWDFFPTFHLSYQLPKEQQVMLSYTRRIERPHGWDLEPFLTWRDAYNVQQGNPALKNEYIDSYELSYQVLLGKNTFSIDIYDRKTNNKIERVRMAYPEKENVILQTSENVGFDNSLGAELMFGLDLFKWWRLDLMGNLYSYKVEGKLFNKDFSEESFNWNTRLNATFKIGKASRLQLNNMYNSKSVSAQGEREGFIVTTFAYKQDLFKNKVSLTLQARDIFNTAGHSFTSKSSDFYSYSRFEPYSPMVSLTLTWRLNNYKPDRKKNNNGQQDDMDEGFESF
ncbi:MAG: hypothetical protein A2W99_06990 [Bacteroidetes bacterium GWF2_33_16]|nr:MAG: hypothetical protein A2X00_07115 [Bacteroidetes bacterium GWE2_32_14]OFY02799.1 MAG: hypothetical protein A2W99_06990 [Bacteroidetes bacterium GWF2_33_16]